VASSEKERRPLSRRLNSDVAAGGVTLVLGTVFTVVALQIPPTTFANSVLQPRHVPIVIGVGLMLSGLALAVHGLLVGRSRGEQELPESLAEDLAEELEELPEPPEQPRHLIVLSLLFIAYLVAFIPVGFVAATFLFLFAGSMYLQPKKVRRNFLFALLLSLIVYFLFDRALGVVLPDGILGWLL
jgi:putative tricarboxylic transport membrane protein